MHFTASDGTLGVVFGDGSGTQALVINGQSVTKVPVALPTSFNAASTLAQDIADSSKVFVGVHFLVATGITTFTTQIEFLDPDLQFPNPSTEVWVPSKVGVREAATARTWVVTSPTSGASFYFESNAEHKLARKFRARFQGATAGAATRILVNWFTEGGRSVLGKPGKAY